jgi:hypothetical protein
MRPSTEEEMVQEIPEREMTAAEELYHLLNLTGSEERERFRRLSTGFQPAVHLPQESEIEFSQWDCVTGGWEEHANAELE